MNKRLSDLMIVMAVSCAAVSCNQELIHDRGYGYLGIGLVNDESETLISKSASGTEDLVFSVDVLNPSGQSVAEIDDHRTVTADNPLKLPIGTYGIVASNGVNADAAFENPYYEGRTDIRILPERLNSVTVDCKLANTIFSVEFPEEFADNFDVYEVSVTNGSGAKLVLSNSPQPGNPLEAVLSARAYFKVTGILTWELYLQNKDYSESTQGGIYRTSATYTGVKAKEHYHLRFELGEEEHSDGAFTIKVNIDNGMDDSRHDMVLDFDTKNMPSVQAYPEFGAVSSQVTFIPVGDKGKKVMSFSAPVGMKSLRSTHSDPILTAAGLPETVEYVGLTATRGDLMADMDLTDLIAALPVGDYRIDFSVIDIKGHYADFCLLFKIMTDVDAEAVAARVGWASFARLEAKYFSKEKPEGLTLQYKESSQSQWIELDPERMVFDEDNLTYSTVLTGLEPLSGYVFRAVSAEDKETKEISFTTSAAGTLHNLDFDSWTDSDKFPNADGYMIWDSANSSGQTITTTPTADAVSGYAARLESIKKFGVLAAGNIFTGSFGKTVISGTSAGATLNWGTPFTSRPLALRGYYKYSPVMIDNAKAPYTDLKGNAMDQSQILIFLTDWNSTFEVNTVTQTFVDLDNDPGIIALGQYNSSVSNDAYVKFTLPLVYRDNGRIPSHIVIAAASSRYGDYFTGGVGSVLMLDEFEFIYDPDDLTEEEFSTVFSLVSPF